LYSSGPTSSNGLLGSHGLSINFIVLACPFIMGYFTPPAPPVAMGSLAPPTCPLIPGQFYPSGLPIHNGILYSSSSPSSNGLLGSPGLPSSKGLFYSSGQPIYNEMLSSHQPAHQQWELYCTQTGHGHTRHISRSI